MKRISAKKYILITAPFVLPGVIIIASLQYDWLVPLVLLATLFIGLVFMSTPVKNAGKGWRY